MRRIRARGYWRTQDCRPCRHTAGRVATRTTGRVARIGRLLAHGACLGSGHTPVWPRRPACLPATGRGEGSRRPRRRTAAPRTRLRRRAPKGGWPLAMSPLEQWTWGCDRFPHDDDWTTIPVDLDLADAVTLVASISADITPGREHARYPGDSSHHELGLNWMLRDSLDGGIWHPVQSGWLHSDGVPAVARVSSPLGSRAQVMLRAPALCVRVNVHTGRADDRRKCSTPTTCGVDHEALAMTAVKIDLAVRTI